MAKPELRGQAAVVTGLIDCTTIDEASAKRFVADFGRRAHRRPLDDAQQAPLLEVFRAGTSRAVAS